VEADEWKNRPVTKVINLLKDMGAQLQKEAEQDEELYALPRCPVPCPCERKQDELTVGQAVAPVPRERRARLVHGETEPDHEDQARPSHQYEHSYADLEDQGHSSFQYNHGTVPPETKYEHGFAWEDDAEAVAVVPSPGRGEEAQGGLLTARRDGLLTARRAKSEGDNNPEAAAERARIQGLVNAFVHKAVRGCMCGYIIGSVKSGYERFTTQYRMDRSLQHLCILCPEDPDKAEIVCPIAAIQDISALAEDGEDQFRPEVLARLHPDERRLLLMVVFRCQEQKLTQFYLLEESDDARDDFLEALRILCRYAESNSEGRAPERGAEQAADAAPEGRAAAGHSAEEGRSSDPPFAA